MTKLSKDEKVRLMHAVNQSIADGKVVMVGCTLVYGATFAKKELCFLLPAENLNELNELNKNAIRMLPRVRPVCLALDVVVRAFLPNCTDVDVLYTPQTELTDTALQGAAACDTSSQLVRHADNHSIASEIIDILVANDVKVSEAEDILRLVRKGIGWSSVQPHKFVHKSVSDIYEFTDNANDQN